MLKKIFNLPNLTLLTALCLSTIAAWFAVVGLIAIFPSKATEIVVMGVTIEIGKIVATIWLREYWTRSGLFFKVVLVPMVCILMLLTSMGTFGFLSGAHSEQSAVSGDVGAKVAILDEKIKTQRDNIDLARKALQQLDDQVNQRLSRSDNEQGAERAVQIRRQQAPERNRLQREISEAQSVIAKLNEERAPVASQLRKVEAEVGPIKYIAALIYGDNPDANTLERAVRWVIILLVIVFDPLAIVLVLAGNASRKWDANDSVTVLPDVPVASVIPPTEPPQPHQPLQPEPPQAVVPDPEEVFPTPISQEEVNERMIAASKVVNSTPWLTTSDIKEENDAIDEYGGVPLYHTSHSADVGDLALSDAIESFDEGTEKPFNIKYHPYIFKVPTQRHPPGIELAGPQVYRAAPETIENQDLDITPVSNVVVEPEPVVEPTVDSVAVTTDIGTRVQDEKFHIDAETMRNLQTEIVNGFGTTFPKNAHRGSTFVRVDTYPHKVYKYDGERWTMIEKSYSDSYIQNVTYLQFLIQKIESGECDIDSLTDVEREYITDYLRAQK